ncbi:50S ribosomal protein L36e [Xylaria bambusicola]|uniref:50S ribosomal protein L36e n=1 Tax=Xylaria bambusicola TaxID=326684 RepID=UPI0020088D33|nr:50S ribosomal protein L36e [Xylaria bambusicola]KAI0503267.1 50S ribosomal protein L36e [Xylaria bambusicola]
MRGLWSLVVVATACLSSLSRAQSMPACATDCLGVSLAQSACDPADTACICSDTVLLSSVETCVLANCTVIEGLAAKNATNTLCGVEVRDITATTPIIVAVSGILAIIAVVMRVMDIFPNRSIQPADVCAVFALLTGIPLAVLELVMSSLGFGKDIWTLTPYRITLIVRFTWVTELLYFILLALTKISLLLFYLRVFPSEKFKRLCYITMGVVIASGIAFTLTGIFYCTPISYIWTGWTGETKGHCINFNAFAWSHAVTSIAQDLWIIALPIPSLLNLQLGRRRKIHLVLMFSVGLAITVVSVVRLTTLVQFATTTNPTYDSVSTAYWSVLEAYVSIICCCLPSVRSLLRTMVPSCFGSSNDPNSQSYKLSGTPMKNSRVINKTVTHQISYTPRSNESDDIELVEKGSGQPTKYSGW